MNYGLYLSAAGALQSMHRQDVMTGNLANVATVGFKPDYVTARQRLPERLEDPSSIADPKWLLERLGGGIHSNPTRVGVSQGPLENTGNALDVALEGKGFLVVSGGDRTDDFSVRLTRDGRMTRNAKGELVLATTGQPVLDDGNNPITLATRGLVTIDESGVIRQDGQRVAKLRLADTDASNLVKVGQNQLRISAGRLTEAEDATVRQNHVEQSAVDPIRAMNSMIGASKAAQSNLKMMQYHDGIMEQAVQTFGRVA